MKKRIAMLLFCAALLFQLAAPGVEAADEIYFVATERSVLPLTEETMPFWYNSTLYISSSIFTGIARESIGISHVLNETGDLVVLYGNGKALFFETAKAYARDENGETLFPGAVTRNGQIFVPASMVAKHFDLQYSITGATHGFLVWIRHQDMILTDRQFAKAATGPMNNRYESYLKEQEAKDPDTDTPRDPIQAGQAGNAEGEQVYLCFRGGEETERLLSELDRVGARGVFFCTEEFMTEQSALLRRMTAMGHSVGLLADGADPQRSVEEQLAAGNQALYRATMGKTRLVRLENANAADEEAAVRGGFRCFREDLDCSEFGLHNVSAATTLLREIVDRDADAIIWLGNGCDPDGLRAFLSAAGSAGVQRCAAWSETT